ncbi:hypothetical protein KAT92_06680 [Candidatus Babeliales bacterium]|nr:hypothetical protein [Candidatus Babeliales bacterium]
MIDKNSKTLPIRKAILDDIGVKGDSSNRVIASAKATYAKATNSCSWTVTENVTQVEILCTVAAAAVSDYVRLVLDPGTEAVADVWFNDVGGAAIPVEPDKLPYNKLITISFYSYITELHFDPTVDSTHIGISAVGE